MEPTQPPAILPGDPVSNLATLRALSVPTILVYPETAPEHQIRNTLGTILINLGEQGWNLGQGQPSSVRSAELWGQLVGHSVKGHLSTTNLPRIDHHIFEVNQIEIEL